MKVKETQQKFDFVTGDARGERLALLDAVPIESGSTLDGRSVVNVAAATARSVLRAIESHARRHGRCWASTATIGREVSRSERTVRRAIRFLEDREFVVVDRSDGKAMVCRVNWGEISLRARLPRRVVMIDRESLVDPGHCDANPGHCDANPGHSVRRSVTKRKKRSPPQTPPSTGNWCLVGAGLRRVGVRSWRALLTEIQEGGQIDEAHALAILEHYDDNPGAWTPVALVARLRAAHADTDPRELWWTPLQAWHDAERIRAEVLADAGSRERRPEGWRIDAVSCRRLRAAGLDHCVVERERLAADRWNRSVVST